jgi:hypothetical protein
LIPVSTGAGRNDTVVGTPVCNPTPEMEMGCLIVRWWTNMEILLLY